MKKIALLNCINSNRVCAGASCLQAFNSRTRAFERYQGEDLELVADMKCNGCEAEPDIDAGMIEKLERLKCIGTEVVHVGKCTINKEGKECLIITKTIKILESNGINVVRGTH